ncbi:MAG: VOC family protein, partial [Chthoniobacterales bacterium]
IETVPALPVARQALNLGSNRLRNGEFQRPPRGASQVKRIGHGVLMTTDLHRMVAWYRDTLGLLVSDEIYAGRPDNLVGSFVRVDRGDTYVDHHVFFCVQGNKNGLNHLSFEVQDIDDVMIGHNHLKAKGYAHVWGIGRHQLGSHIFDYWAGPLGPRARALDRYRHAQRRFCAWALRNRRPQWTLGRSHPAVLSRACLDLTATKRSPMRYEHGRERLAGADLPG